VQNSLKATPVVCYTVGHHQTQNQRYSHHEFYGFYPCYSRLVYLSITQQGVAIQRLKTAHYSSFAT
jgi:hypothetical protein